MTANVSLLDYFAAHAPPVPDWWPQVKAEYEPLPGPPADWPAVKLDQWKGWGDYLDDDQIAPAFLAEFRAVRAEWRNALDQNTARRVKAELDSFTGWAWAYAAAMVAARGEG